MEKGKPNAIEVLLLSKFEGQVEERYIGPRLTLPLGKYYGLQWRSEPIRCDAESNGCEGELRFEVFKAKMI